MFHCLIVRYFPVILLSCYVFYLSLRVPLCLCDVLYILLYINHVWYCLILLPGNSLILLYFGLTNIYYFPVIHKTSYHISVVS